LFFSACCHLLAGARAAGGLGRTIRPSPMFFCSSCSSSASATRAAAMVAGGEGADRRGFSGAKVRLRRRSRGRPGSIPANCSGGGSSFASGRLRRRDLPGGFAGGAATAASDHRIRCDRGRVCGRHLSSAATLGARVRPLWVLECGHFGCLGTSGDLVKLLFGCPKTLQLGNPSLCRSLCRTGEHDARGLVRLGNLNSVADQGLWDDPIAWL
jgi:hypothetical protein